MKKGARGAGGAKGAKGLRAEAPRAKAGAKSSRTFRTRRTPRTSRTSRTSRTRRTSRTPNPVTRWNPDPEEVQRSVVKLVLSLVEFIRKLMERQAIRRMEEQTLTAQEVENIGVALMRLEETIRDLAERFNLDIEDLNLDLGPVGRLH